MNVKIDPFSRFSIIRAGDIESRLSMLVYGEPGVGKTILGASASEVPELSPVLILDFDVGATSVKVRYPDVDVLPIKNASDARYAIKAVVSGGSKYKTFVLDDLNELYAMLLEEVVGKNPAYAPGSSVQIQDWGSCTSRMRNMLWDLKDLDVNIIATTTSEDQKDEYSGQLFKRPSLPGKLALEIGKHWDIVGYLFTKPKGERVERILQVQPYNRVVAKDRWSAFGAKIVDPNIKKIYDVIYKGGDIKTEAPDIEEGITVKLNDS